MTDLNEWRLDDGVNLFDFGLLATDFPLAVQVEIGEPDLEVQDTKHPTSDGVIMGRDTLGGFTMTFTLATVPDSPAPAKPWVPALDLLSQFKANWRIDRLRRTPGELATLINLDRNRLVYGRPRKCSPKLERARKGNVQYVATFDTISPDFYDATEKSVELTPAPPVVGGFAWPVVFPFATDDGGSAESPLTNDGDTEAWPVIEFGGPGRAYSLTVTDGEDELWSVTLDKTLGAGQSVVVDTRPWRRSATLDGGPGNGLIRGSQLEKCMLPVGTFQCIFTVTDRSGQAFCNLNWRDAYASL